VGVEGLTTLVRHIRSLLALVGLGLTGPDKGQLIDGSCGASSAASFIQSHYISPCKIISERSMMYTGFLAARADNLVGVVPPPLGIVPDFLHPYSRQPMLLQACLAGLVFVLLFFSMHMWTRIAITRVLGWDDCESSPSSIINSY
jgi:hypothetical protein